MPTEVQFTCLGFMGEKRNGRIVPIKNITDDSSMTSSLAWLGSPWGAILAQVQANTGMHESGGCFSVGMRLFLGGLMQQIQTRKHEACKRFRCKSSF